MTSRVDVLVFPLIAQGHILPLMSLSEALATHGLSVAFLTTPSNVQRLRRRAAAAGVALHEIPAPPLPGLPEGADSIEKVPPALHSQFMEAIEGMEAPFRDAVAHLRPRCIVNDVKPLFVPAVAEEAAIPVLAFVSGVYNVALVLAVARCVPLGATPATVPLLGGTATLRDSDVRRPFRGARKTDPFVQLFLQATANLKRCKGVIENTVNELEADNVARFEAELGVPVWPVGPLLPRDHQLLESTHPCVTWLASQKARSVIYVCFGSEVVLGREQLAELALGLEASLHPFLWVVKEPHGQSVDDVAVLLPPGFVERTRERGYVLLGWAPQQDVLRHPSTGGFVSHSGWNSVMESVSQGIPMLTCPFQLDQPFAAKLVVEGLKMGAEVRMVEREGEFVMERGHVERAVKLLMESEEGQEIRRKAVEWKETVKRAMAEDGSSPKNLLKIVEIIRNS